MTMLLGRYHEIDANSHQHPIDDVNVDRKDEEIAFLATLPVAQEISIRLIERRDPQNYMQGIFSVTLTSKATPDSNECVFITTKYGIRDPNSSWPVFVFLVDESQSNLLWNRLLPALTSTPNLQTLTLQGCARTPGFYTRLQQTITTVSLIRLNIASWIDFCSSVDWDVISSRLGNLQHLYIAYYKWNETGTRQLRDMLLRNSGCLKTLHLETGTMPWEFWSSIEEGLQDSTLLQSLVWIGRIDQPKPFSEEAMARFCSSLKSKHRLRKLKLSWNTMLPAVIEHIINSLKLTKVSTLSLSFVDNGGVQVLHNFLQNDQSVTTLEIEVAESCSNVIPLVEGIRVNSGLRNVSMSKLTLNEDTVKALSECLAHNNCLQSISMDFHNVESDYMQDILRGLSLNSSLQSVRLSCPLCVLNLSTCFALRNALIQNSSLQHLHLGCCRVPPLDECAIAIAEGVMANTTLQTLHGLTSAEEKASISSIMTNALECNMTMVDLSYTHPEAMANAATKESVSKRDNKLYSSSLTHSLATQELESKAKTSLGVGFYLKLNQMGRRHIMSPNAFDAVLIPHVLTKRWSVDEIYYIIRSRVDWFP